MKFGVIFLLKFFLFSAIKSSEIPDRISCQNKSNPSEIISDNGRDNIVNCDSVSTAVPVSSDDNNFSSVNDPLTSTLQNFNSQEISLSSCPSDTNRYCNFPIDKPNYCGQKPEYFMEENCNVKQVDLLFPDTDINRIIEMIPENFLVLAKCGSYPSSSSDINLSSSDLMKKRSALYYLLSILYLHFDTFNTDDFELFFKSFPKALKNQDLRYHLVENLMLRSTRTSNQGTIKFLAQFVNIIDNISTARTAGKFEKENFNEFLQRIDIDLRKMQRKIRKAIEKFLSNEFKRLSPLDEVLRNSDYEAAKSILESSSNSIFITLDEFEIILELPCSSSRYNFISWAIEFGYFNANERFGKYMITPLMMAAMNSKWSNDIVKAILFKSPESNLIQDLNGLLALDYAKHNSSL